MIKETAKHVIDSLPNESTMDDIINALYIHEKFVKGEREIGEGEGIEDEQARRRLNKWVK